MQANGSIIAVIICYEETVLRFYDCGIAIAVFEITLQQSALGGKGQISSVAETRAHIHEGKSAFVTDRQHKGRSFGAFPVLAVLSETMITDGIENGNRTAVNLSDLHGGIRRSKTERGHHLAKVQTAVGRKALVLMSV